MIRSVSSCGLGVLRQIEDQLLKKAENLNVTCAREVAYYLLNEKRDSLLILEQTYGATIFVIPSLHDMKGTAATIERAQDREHTPRRMTAAAPVQMDSALQDEPEEEIVEEADVETEDATGESESRQNLDQNGDGDGNGKRRRRRGRRGSRRGERDRPEGEAQSSAENGDPEANPQDGDDKVFEGEPVTTEHVEGDAEPNVEGNLENADRSPRRGRGNRFGRNRGRRGERNETSENASEVTTVSEGADGVAPEVKSERPPREDRGPRRERGDRGPRRDRPERGERPPREQQLVVPTEPAFKLEIPDVISEPEARKWTPPAPTVQAEAAPKKGGWWNKLKS
jgi:ribonuclease E